MTDSVLQTKLYVPPLRSSLVPRPRLIARLDAGLDGRLTLISASAGYGKTTLVTEWLQAGEHRVAWLSLDENDNDPRRFLAYVLAALRQVQEEIGRAAEAMLQSPQSLPGEVILTALVNELAAVPQPFILILDDYHIIDAPPIHQQLSFLLDHQPPPMHLVVITREDPFGLPLARLRARGQMVEIRQEDLRFSLEECADFLSQVMGLNLSPPDIAALERRTEGWIAGLQLAALSMQGRDNLPGFIEAFTGSSHYVLDYLIEEVFARQPAEVQDFLLKTSILDRFTAGSCDAVMRQKHSREMLQTLDRSNLFIVPLDQSRTWYRYHHLFAELLRQRLRSTDAAAENELHRLASHWFAAEKLIPEAIQHALAAKDWNLAAELIEKYSVTMLRSGELVTLLGWLKSLPDEVVYTRPPLCRDYGWVLTLTGQLDAAVPYLDCAERALQGDDEHLGQVMVAQAYLARTRGDYPRAVALSKQALEFVAEDDVLHRGLVTFTLGFALFNAGHLEEAEPALLEACEAARASGNDYARQTALGLLGAIQKNQGRLRRAAEFCRQALQEAHGSPTAAQVQVFLASVLYEWNELDAASEQLAQAFKASQSIGNLAIRPEIYRIMAHIHQARGDSASAVGALNDFNQLIQNLDSPPARAMVAALHADIALAQGDISSATHWANQVTKGVDFAALGLQHGLTQARLLLAQGKQAEAAKMLAGLHDSVAQMGLVAVMIDVRALQALAAETPAEAIHFLQSALKMAQPEGFIRTFVDKGEPMRFLLERLKSEGGELKEYALTILSAFGEAGKASISQPLIEPMSERELEILRLLADGLSNREIAEKLVISVGTTKSHVHHILEKMGADSRTQAVAKARELGLL